MAGSFADEAPEALLAANPRFLASFSLVIATQVTLPFTYQLAVAQAVYKAAGLVQAFNLQHGLPGIQNSVYRTARDTQAAECICCMKRHACMLLSSFYSPWVPHNGHAGSAP